MELRKFRTKGKPVVIAPIGDLQWSGEKGSTAVAHAKRHIARALDREAYFIGMGDYIDFASPSNRKRLASAALYDTAEQVIVEAAENLVEEVYEDILKPTKGRWIGLLEGHHFFEAGGNTSDMYLAQMLDAEFLGTSAFVRLEPSGVVLWAHHGTGGGQLPGAMLNKLYHQAAGLHGADVYMIGHSTKMGAVRLSRPEPDWTRGNGQLELKHRDILLVNTGGFSKSNVVGSANGRILRGDYAEQRMLTPSPLAAPLVVIQPDEKHAEDRIRAEV